MASKNLTSRISLLDTVPVRMPKITSEYGDDGLIVLAYPRFPYPWMGKLFPRYSAYIHVPLEKYGTAVWEQIDGVRTVAEIAEIVKQQFPEEADTLQGRVAAYIQQLHKDRFISLLCRP